MKKTQSRRGQKYLDRFNRMNLQSRQDLYKLVGPYKGFSGWMHTLSIDQVVTGPGYIERVIDGDTFVVRVCQIDFDDILERSEGCPVRQSLMDPGQNTVRIRIGNVDAPESVHPDITQNTREGKALSKMLKEKLTGANVILRCFDWDIYGRVVASMELPSGKDFGLWLIENNYSGYIPRPQPNPFYGYAYYKAARRWGRYYP